jgi:hypothetical protein
VTTVAAGPAATAAGSDLARTAIDARHPGCTVTASPAVAEQPGISAVSAGRTRRGRAETGPTVAEENPGVAAVGMQCRTGSAVADEDVDNRYLPGDVHERIRQDECTPK